jgi:hypothetical protein
VKSEAATEVVVVAEVVAEAVAVVAVPATRTYYT